MSTPESVRRGDVEAFAAIFEEHHRSIYRYLCRLVDDADLAEDLAQHAFLKAYQALAEGSPPANLKAWLHTVATNAAFSALRRRKLIAWLPLARNAEAAGGASRADQETRLGEQELVAQALAELSPRDAACLLLHFQQGLTCQELAEALGVSLSAAKMRLYRARAAFCEAYLHLSQEVSG